MSWWRGKGWRDESGKVGKRVDGGWGVGGRGGGGGGGGGEKGGGGGGGGGGGVLGMKGER